MAIERSPAAIAQRTLEGLEQLMTEANKKEPFSILCQLCDEADIGGDDVIEIFKTFDEQDNLMQTLMRLGVSLTMAFPGIAYAKQALKEKDPYLAWGYAAEANYWHGVVGGTQDGGNYLIKTKAASAANKRHIENHAIKADAMKYYAENISKFTSKDSAAEQIAGKVVPAKFRTVRQWITAYHKELRSAGTV